MTVNHALDRLLRVRDARLVLLGAGKTQGESPVTA
jgi:hypothetical protein